MAVFEKGELVQGWFIETYGQYNGQWSNDTEVYLVTKQFDTAKIKGFPKEGERFQSFEELKKVLDFLIKKGNLNLEKGEELVNEDDFDPAIIMILGN